MIHPASWRGPQLERYLSIVKNSYEWVHQLLQEACLFLIWSTRFFLFFFYVPCLPLLQLVISYTTQKSVQQRPDNWL